MAGSWGTIRRRSFGRSGLCRVGLSWCPVLAVLPAAAPAAITEFTVPTAISQPAGITVGPTGPCGSPRRTATRSGGSRPRGHHGVPDPDRSRARPGDHRRPRRGSVVHRVRRQPAEDRPDDDRRRVHRVRASARQRARRDHHRPRRRPLVHRERHEQDRPDHDRRRLPTEYPLPGVQPGDITPGPDGRLWFTESEANKIGAITTACRTSPSTTSPGSDPSGIAASGGALWFTGTGRHDRPDPARSASRSRISARPAAGLRASRSDPTARCGSPRRPRTRSAG